MPQERAGQERPSVPIYSPFDSISKAVPGQLADLSFVVLPRTKRSKLNQLPYIGPAWYARPSVEWMLHVGLAIARAGEQRTASVTT